MGIGTGCGAREKRQGRAQSKGGGAGSESPARVPCVQRQKMVSERPGLLLVPHTSSTSSLVCSDMMGHRRTSLCVQDSRPGTWGRGGSGDRELRDCRAEAAGRLDARQAKGERAAYSSAPVRQLQRQLSFPYRKSRTTHFRLLSRYPPTTPRNPGVTSPEAEVGVEGGADLCGSRWLC